MEDGASFLSESEVAQLPGVRSVLRLGRSVCLVRYEDGRTALVSVDARGRFAIDVRTRAGAVVRHGPLEPPRARGRVGASDTRSAASPGLVTSPTAGTVRRVMVAEGDRVEPGTVLVIIEVMKMELEVSATAAGRVTSVPVEAGRAVERGSPLVHLVPA